MEDLTVKDIELITAAIKESAGIDFTSYAFSSLKRRISRFMESKRIRDIDGFIASIKNDREFSENLVEEITVNVTEMFRDPSFWTAVKNLIIPAFSIKDRIRIWHAACSTGEEVISMAILLKQAGLYDKTEIIATDLNKNVLATASRSVYSIKSQEVNSRNFEQAGCAGKLSDYYQVIDNRAHFDTSLLKNASFRLHDLSGDDQIGVFDMIICRNVLIYFNSDLQERVVRNFHRCLAENAFLGIGSKESLRWSKLSNSFREVSIEEKIYRKPVARIIQPVFA